MDGDASEEGGCERARSWYLTREEIERGSPSRRDGVGAAKEDELRTTYCCFIRDVCTRLQLPQITRATAILLCHRFYLHQSHAKNEWQTIATVCVFLASKIEDTPCLLKHVVIAAYETMYRKTPDAAKRIHQEEVLAKQKALILVGETLLLSTIRFDFNIQHPYEPLKLLLTNLGISHKEVRQLAMRFINETLPTTLAVQFKPHLIAAGSLFHAAKCHNFILPSKNGKMWWNEFDVAQEELQAIVQEMSEILFKKRDPCSMVSANKPVPTPTPIPTPTDKHQQIKLPATPALMDKQAMELIPTPTLTDRQQKTRTPAPALRHAQSSMRSFSSSNTKASSCVTAGSSFDKLTSCSASNEENRYQQTDEESRQRTNEENQYRRTNEQNQYRRTNEQSQHRRMDEENHYHRRMDEEKQYRRRMDEENRYRRRMDEENRYRRRMDEDNRYRWTYEENQHRRMNEENQHRRMNEENQHRQLNEENQHRWRNEENQYRWMNEEKLYRRMNDKQYRQAHRNHNLVPVDQRLEKQSYRGTLKSDGGYHATIIMDLTIQKRRIQDPVYISDANDWRIGPLKKQKLERR